MSESISAFDGNYVRFGQVAALLAQERPQCAFDDVMDLVKRAVLAGEFDPSSLPIVLTAALRHHRQTHHWPENPHRPAATGADHPLRGSLETFRRRTPALLAHLTMGRHPKLFTK
jgi:hypothetical protein